MADLGQDLVEALKGNFYVIKETVNGEPTEVVKGIYRVLGFDEQQPTMAVVEATPIDNPGQSHTRKQYFFDLTSHERAPQDLVERLVGGQGPELAPTWYNSNDDPDE